MPLTASSLGNRAYYYAKRTILCGRDHCQNSLNLPTEGWPGWVGLSCLDKSRDSIPDKTWLPIPLLMQARCSLTLLMWPTLLQICKTSHLLQNGKRRITNSAQRKVYCKKCQYSKQFHMFEQFSSTSNNNNNNNILKECSSQKLPTTLQHCKKKLKLITREQERLHTTCKHQEVCDESLRYQ